jgi:hypothetical protein
VDRRWFCHPQKQMTTLIFTWYLLTIPGDRLLCSLWLNHIPSVTEYRQACGQVVLDGLHLHMVGLQDGVVYCDIQAGRIFQVTDACSLHMDLDQYFMQIVQLDYQQLVCSITVSHEGEPTAEEIIAGCDGGSPTWLQAGEYALQYIGSSPSPEPDPVWTCTLPDLPLAILSADISTQEDYLFLAARLIWWGYVPGSCGDGTTGINILTWSATPCGMGAARAAVRNWQNRLDQVISIAGEASNVPPVVLKRLIAQESQFWPLWTGTDGESGMIQLTNAGADTVLRYSTIVYEQICPLAIYPGQCSNTYDTIGSVNQAALREALLAILWIGDTTPEAGIRQARVNLPLYAESLAAYWCYSAELGDPSWSGALSLWNEDFR